MINIEYSISVILKNKITGVSVKFDDNKILNTLLEHESCLNETFKLFEGNLFDLFDERISLYVSNNALTYNDIEISNFNVTTSNEYVEILVENNKNFTLDLNIVVHAFYSDKGNIASPVLTGEAISPTKITLHFPVDSYAHKVYNEIDELIANVPIGVYVYTEENLVPETEYIRKIVSYNSNTTSNYSNLITIKTLPEVKDESIIQFNQNYDRNNNIVPINVVNERLRAFKSGVGDGNDLKIYKPTETDFVNTFDIMANVYGSYYEKVTSFDKVSFDYRIACIGKVDKKETNGFVKFKVKTATSGSVKLRVYKYVTKPINVKSMASAKIAYLKVEGGLSVPKIVSLNTDVYTKTIDGKVVYSPTTKNAYLSPYESLAITTTPIISLIKDKALQNIEIKDTNQSTWEYFDFKIKDDYVFDELSNKYSPNKTRTMSDAQLGTIVTHSSNKTFIDRNSGLYLSGYSNGNLFDGEKIITKTFNTNEQNVVVLTKSEIDAITMTNIGDRSYVYDGLGADTVVKIEVLDVSDGVTLSSVNLSNSNVLTATLNTNHETSILQYKFTNSNDTISIDTNNVISGIGSLNNIVHDYTMTIIDSSSNISCSYGDSATVEQNIYPGQILTWEDSCFSKILFKAKEEIVTYPYEDIQPSYIKEPFHGVVNNKTNENGDYIKKDMVFQMPKFLIPSEIYGVKFKLITDNIYPLNAHLNAKFYNEDSLGYTSINGDFIKFSSNANMEKSKLVTDLLSIQLCEQMNLAQDQINTMELNSTIYAPSEASVASKYTRYTINLFATSPDINISNYNPDIDFSINQEVIVPYKLKIMKSAASKWCPLIKNGYYYLNQDEYYLFSSSQINSTYEDSFDYKSKTLPYKLKVDLLNTALSSGTENYILDEGIDYNYSNRLIYEGGWLLPKPTIEGLYYKKYDIVEEIVKEIHFKNKVSKYNYIKWLTSSNNNEITVCLRSFNTLTNSWSTWVIVENNTIPNIPLSYKIQIKLKYIPNVITELTQIKDTLSSYDDFYNDCDMELSKNIFLLNGHIQTSNLENGIYFSKILKFEVDTEFKISTYFTEINKSKSPYISLHVASSQNRYELETNPKWVLLDGISSLSGKYFRYRIEISSNINVISLYKDIKTLKTLTKPQGIKNIEVSVSYENNDLTNKVLYIDKTFNIQYDAIDKIISKNVLSEIEYPIMSLGYDIEDIQNVSIVNENEDIIMNMHLKDYNINTENIYDVFNGWRKIEKGNDYWLLDNNNKSITHTKPTEYFSSYISYNKYSKWELSCNLASNSNYKNPIGIVLAYELDSSGEEHILSLLIGPNKQANQQGKIVEYGIYYNYGKWNELLIIDKSYLILSTTIKYWSELTYGINVNVKRIGSTINISRSQTSIPVLDLGTSFSINLDDYPQLMIFSDKAAFGFCTKSQQNAKFSNIFIEINDVINSVVTAKTNTIQMLTSNTEYIELINNKAIMSPLPQQFSPVVVETENGTSLTRVHFNNKIQNILVNTEIFQDVGSSIRLAYSDIDNDSVEIYVNEVLLDKTVSYYNIVNNYIFFESLFKASDIIKVNYKISNSFIVNYNLPNNEIEVEVHSKENINKVSIKYETNEFDSRVPLENLSLNPIYNTSYQGFIYLSDEVQQPTNIETYVNPKYVHANGNDNVIVCVRLVDKHNNPVPGETIYVSCGYGRIGEHSDITDSNGVISFKYYSTIIKCTDYIDVRHVDSNMFKKIKIENLEV